MNHKAHIQQVITDELSRQIQESGYVLHTVFIQNIVDTYGFTVSEIAGALGRSYKQLGLCRMRASNTIKRYYGLNVKAYPIIYIREKE